MAGEMPRSPLDLAAESGSASGSLEAACLSKVGDPTRLAALARYGGVEVCPPESLDDIARLASRMCRAEVALISLFGAEQQVFKACVGTSLDALPITRTVCTYALSHPGVLVIPDLARDARTVAFDFVAGAPHMRFYAGTPLIAADGSALGTICVLDPKPRPRGLEHDQAADLLALARQVVARFDQARIDRHLRTVIDERDALLVELAEEQRRDGALLAMGDAMREVNEVHEIVRIAARTLCETLGLDRAGYAIVAADGDGFDLVADWCAPGVASIVGQYRIRDFLGIGSLMREGRIVVVEDVMTDPITEGIGQACLDLGIRHLVAVPIVSGGALRAAFCLHHSEILTWSAAMLRFAQNVTDRTCAAVTRSGIETRQGLLNQEIAHRMKNLLALVQSIAIQTLRGCADTQVESLMARFQSLGRAHDILLGGHVAEGDLSSLIRTVLSVHIGEDSSRLHLAGEPMEIPSEIALSLALILHELGTNATKYGSWSNAAGGVEISWWRAEDGRLKLSWREAGGPPVLPPSRSGFGSRLIERGLFGAGSVCLDYEPTGVYCILDVTLIKS
jgi:two-component sensor histidine kinase